MRRTHDRSGRGTRSNTAGGRRGEGADSAGKRDTARRGGSRHRAGSTTGGDAGSTRGGAAGRGSSRRRVGSTTGGGGETARWAEAERASLELRVVRTTEAAEMKCVRLEAVSRDLAEVRRERDAVFGSTVWRATQPIRSLGCQLPPPIRQTLRRSIRATYWLATLQFRRRLSEWREAQAGHDLTSEQVPALLVELVADPPPVADPPLVADPPPVAEPPWNRPEYLVCACTPGDAFSCPSALSLLPGHGYPPAPLACNRWGRTVLTLRRRWNGHYSRRSLGQPARSRPTDRDPP